MAGKKKTSKKDESVDDISEEMAADIHEAVAAEDKPRAKSGSTKIPITHWEETTNQESSESADEIVAVDSIPDIEDDADEDTADALDEIEAHEDTQTSDEASEDSVATAEEADDEHAWHMIDEGEEDDAESDEELDDADELTQDRDVAKSEQNDDEIEEHPEWDEEKWQQANLDEEEPERPEWDEEKWQKSDQDQAADEDFSHAAEEPGDEPSVVAAERELSGDIDEEIESPDRQSAAQAALNNDELNTRKRNRFRMIADRMSGWWQTAKIRNSLLVSAALLLLIVIAVPTPRYAALNLAGVRAQASVAIVDSETQLPLRDVSVELAGVSALTDEQGVAELDGVKLGSQDMVVTKTAFDTYTEKVNVGFGQNSYDSVDLVGIGSRFEFRVVDWLTDAPLDRAEVAYGENSAFTDDSGVAVLNASANDETSITVLVTAPNYAPQEVEIDTTDRKQTEVPMVIGRYHMFISERDGRYDVYRILADGSNEELILEGTGNERDGLRFDTSPSGRYSVLVATRDNGIRNPDGFVLSGLYLIPTNGDQLNKVDSSERIDLIGWIGERMIYVKVQAGASGQNPERHRLMSLDVTNGETTQIAASNFFNDVMIAQDYIFYAPSDAYKQNPQAYLFRSNADGSVVETVFQGEVWTILRTGYNSIEFDSNQVWYSGRVDSILNRESESPPTSFISRLYTPNPSNSKSAWVDVRDGKGTLIVNDSNSEEERTVIRLGGLRGPLVWLSDTHLIFRVATTEETADYVINVEGGDPLKITDVTNVSGADRWYYYY